MGLVFDKMAPISTDELSNQIITFKSDLKTVIGKKMSGKV